MFDRCIKILNTETSDLCTLAEAAGEDPRTFWCDADLSNVDLRNQDLRDLDLSSASLTHAITDHTTLLPAAGVSLKQEKQQVGFGKGSHYRLLILKRHTKAGKQLLKEIKSRRIERLFDLIELGRSSGSNKIWEYMNEIYENRQTTIGGTIPKSWLGSSTFGMDRFSAEFGGDFVPSGSIFVSGLLNAGLEIENGSSNKAEYE